MPKVPIPRPGPIALAMAAALTVGVIPATAAVSAYSDGEVSHNDAGHQTPGDAGTHTVTLITGDKVTHSGPPPTAPSCAPSRPRADPPPASTALSWTAPPMFTPTPPCRT